MASGIFTRVGVAPLLTPGDVPGEAAAVFNPGVAQVGDEVLLLLRIEDQRGVSHLRVARSRNGVDGWRIGEQPLLEPDLPEHPFEEWGCEDARITRISHDTWVIAYTAYSRYGPTIALATTKDFVTATRLGAILSPLNKDAALLPQQTDGHWILLHRPVAGGGEHIWYILGHRDLTHWGLPGVVLPERGGPWWDGLKVGVGAPPIRTKEGWLLIYHGVKVVANLLVYRLGLGLLDLADPRRLTHRASHWAFAPETPYETQGFAPNCVYTCGALERGDELWMYYGCADTCVGLATAKTADLLHFVHQYDFLDQTGVSKGMME